MKKNHHPVSVQTRLIASLPPAEQYTAPHIEVIDIELENMFAASPTTDPLPGMPGQPMWPTT